MMSRESGVFCAHSTSHSRAPHPRCPTATCGLCRPRPVWVQISMCCDDGDFEQPLPPAFRGWGPLAEPLVSAQGGTGPVTPDLSWPPLVTMLPVKWWWGGSAPGGQTEQERAGGNVPPTPGFLSVLFWGQRERGECHRKSSLRDNYVLICHPVHVTKAATASLVSQPRSQRWEATSLKASPGLFANTCLEGEPGHVPRTAVLGSCGHRARHQPTSLEEFLRSFLMAVPMLFIVYLDFLFSGVISVFLSGRKSLGALSRLLLPPDSPRCIFRITVRTAALKLHQLCPGLRRRCSQRLCF